MAADRGRPRLVLGLKLKALRQKRGLPLREVAAAAGLSISYLSELEKGKKYPKPDRLVALAEALDVPFDELVTLRVDEELSPLAALARSPWLREFPLELFGVQPEDLLALMAADPARAGALVRAFVDVGRFYDVQVEQLLLAALRAYQQLHRNYFEDLEDAAAAYRKAHRWDPRRSLAPTALAAVLRRDHGYQLDETTLPDHPELGGFRSVLLPGPRPRLLINGRLLPAQRAFLYARELGFLHLGLRARPLTSSWLQVESFDEALNNFRASYFAGALLMEREGVLRDLRRAFRQPRWDAQAFLAPLRRLGVTPEMYLYRVTELAPRFLGLGELFFLRFSQGVFGDGGWEDGLRLTKLFNLSRVPVPHGLGLAEHHCRRWPALRLLAELAGQEARAGVAGDTAVPRAAASRPLVAAQRSWFFPHDAEFFVVAMARPFSIVPGAHTGVALGFLMDDAFRGVARFAADPAVPRVAVHLTCERCPLPPSECAERAAPPRFHARNEEQRRKRAALAALAAAAGSASSRPATGITPRAPAAR
jgi:transcriptional regulator with XRE-family HTH domain